MHIVIGGAFNGKKTYVKQRIKSTWFDGELPIAPQTGNVVITNLEKIVAKNLQREEQQVALEIAEQLMELDKQCAQLILIVTDISRGIVPVDPLERQLRDTCGRLYQVLFKEAATITRVWYGIAETIKKGDGWQ